MHIDSSSTKSKDGQVYTRHLLRQSIRDGRKVNKRTIANLSHCSPEEIVAIKLALRNKHDLSQVGSLSKDVEVHQGTSFGATYVLKNIAERIGLVKALGQTIDGKLALWQVIARLMNQGSRLSAVRLAEQQSAVPILDMEAFNEDDLYSNLDWLSDHQALIEQSLYEHRFSQHEEFFLYDITSSYLEGTQNELASWGYNRDKKNGKMIIVVGLLCDQQGIPMSIEVFDGSTSDCTTVKAQMDKIAKRWGVGSITLVGDKGMIQGPQIQEITEAGHSFITTIRKAAIEPLVVGAGYQTHLIDEDILEIIEGDYRYLVRRNPVQAKETSENRKALISTIEYLITKENRYLEEHKKATIAKSLDRVTKKIKKFKLEEITKITVKEGARELVITIDPSALDKATHLDGCYAMKTNLKNERFSKQLVHDKYKALSLVEDAFRCSKTELLEMRPIHVRLQKRTRGHVFVVMLAYLIVKELERCWKSLNMTTEEGLDTLRSYQTVDLHAKGRSVLKTVPRPNKVTKQLFDLAKVEIPNQIPSSDIHVDTRKKLGKDRK